jgi:ribose 5-phosphate isomerase B
MRQTVFVASDHDAFQVKERIVTALSVPSNMTIKDLGTDHDDFPIDFPIYAKMVADLVIETPESKGILLSYAGIGMAIMANKVNGIRAILGINPELAVIGRKEYDANICCVSSRFMSFEIIRDTVRAFLETKYNDDDIGNVRRLYMLDKLSSY